MNLPKPLFHFHKVPNTTAVPFQPNIHHRLKHTYTPAPSANHQLSKRSSPYLHPKLQAIYHTTHHLGQLLNPHRYDIPNFIHFSPSIFPYPPPTQTHIYAQLKEQQSDDQNHTHQHRRTTTYNKNITKLTTDYSINLTKLIP